jgi:hypothetical protein
MAEVADARQRNSYWDTVRGDLGEMRRAARHKDIVDLIKKEPYVLPGSELARQMRDSCRALGQDRVAALFDKDLEALQPKEQPPQFKLSNLWAMSGTSSTSPTFTTYTS